MSPRTALEAETFLQELPQTKGKDVRIAPPFTLIREMAGNRQGIRIGGQNMHPYAEGAFTGEISLSHLKEAGADFVILGHSERRHLLGETLEFIQGKVERAIVSGFSFVLCVGETLEDREGNRTMDVLHEQLESAFDGVSEEQLRQQCLIAYEPVWAIGTGKTPSNGQISDVHREIKERYDVPVLYGGSVTLENFKSIITQEGVDGALVGGASLKSELFGQMIQQME